MSEPREFFGLLRARIGKLSAQIWGNLVEGFRIPAGGDEYEKCFDKYQSEFLTLFNWLARLVGFCSSSVLWLVISLPVGIVNALSNVIRGILASCSRFVNSIRYQFRHGQENGLPAVTHLLTHSVLSILFLASPLAVLAFGGIGLFEIGLAVVYFFAHREVANPTVTGPGGVEAGALVEATTRYDAASALATAISGIEFILLAVLPFFFFRSLTNYVDALRNESSGSSPQPEVLHALTHAKALSIALLFSIVATHLVGKLIGSQSDQNLGLEEAGVGGLLLVLLGTFYFLLEKSVRSNSEHISE